jgi:hypothetical protein
MSTVFIGPFLHVKYEIPWFDFAFAVCVLLVTLNSTLSTSKAWISCIGLGWNLRLFGILIDRRNKQSPRFCMCS